VIGYSIRWRSVPLGFIGDFGLVGGGITSVTEK